jgi:hypothetical protein
MEYQYETTFNLFNNPVFLTIYLVFILFMLFTMWRVFEKANQPGWYSVIPIFNLYIMLKIGGKPGWWLLLYIVPIANIVVAIWSLNMISKSFGKDEGFTFGLIFLSIIFWPILAFSRAKYLGPYGDKEAFRAYQNQHDFDFEKDNKENRNN